MWPARPVVLRTRRLSAQHHRPRGQHNYALCLEPLDDASSVHRRCLVIPRAASSPRVQYYARASHRRVTSCDASRWTVYTRSNRNCFVIAVEFPQQPWCGITAVVSVIRRQTFAAVKTYFLPPRGQTGHGPGRIVNSHNVSRRRNMHDRFLPGLPFITNPATTPSRAQP
jgi:hypothetical protein